MTFHNFSQPTDKNVACLPFSFFWPAKVRSSRLSQFSFFCFFFIFSFTGGMQPTWCFEFKTFRFIYCFIQFQENWVWLAVLCHTYSCFPFGLTWAYYTRTHTHARTHTHTHTYIHTHTPHTHAHTHTHTVPLKLKSQSYSVTDMNQMPVGYI